MTQNDPQHHVCILTAQTFLLDQGFSNSEVGLPCGVPEEAQNEKKINMNKEKMCTCGKQLQNM